MRFFTKDYWFPAKKADSEFENIEDLIKTYGEKCERPVTGWAWITCEKTGYLKWCCIFHGNYHRERLKEKKL